MYAKQRMCARLVVLFGSLLIVSIAAAQSDQGAISGTVLDSSGAVVSGAEVIATGADTGVVYKTTSGPNGAYRIPYAKLGTYNVTTTAPGFKKSEQKGVVVQVNSTASLEVTLQPGDAKETMTVIADAPAVQSQTSEIGTVVTTKQIQDLPLSLSASSQSNLRSPETFVFLTPGTAGPGTNSDHANTGIFESKLGGGQNFATEVILDGVSTQRAESGSAFDQTAPSVEALSEFKVVTSTIPAEFGRTSGGVESFATKSGTNRFHGTAFNFFRNDKLDANSWNNNFNGAHKPRDHQNDFGGSLGGPIWIPKIYNGKDRSFFFFSWEQYRNRPGTSVVSTLPTDAERQGDFSALTADNIDSGLINPCDGSHVILGQIFDPATSNPNPAGPPCHTAFPGNIIPAARFSSVAQKALGLFPAGGPNGPGCNDVICSNFIFNSSKTTYDTTMTFRLDHTIGTSHKLFFSYSSRDQEQINGSPTLPGPFDTNFFNSNFTHYLRFGYDYAISPNLLNHFVVGLSRLANFSKGVSIDGRDWDQFLGISNASGTVIPQFTFRQSPRNVGYNDLGAGNNDRNIPSSVVFADSIAWAKGRHSLRFGFEYRAIQLSRLLDSTSPAYEFSAFQTGFQPNSSVSGDPFASFLLGVPNRAQLSINSVQPRWSSKYYAFYAQDDFKLLPNLMLNLGFRYSVDTPRREAHNAMAVLDLAAPNPGAGGAPGALVYGSNATGAKTYYKNFAPRIGFSYAPSHLKDVVLRGGYSIYYAPLHYADFGGSVGNALLSGTTARPDFQSPDQFTPVQSPDLGFPGYPPPTNNTDPALLVGTFSSPGYAAASYGKPGMVQNWSFEIQDELAKDLILSIGYVGAHSTRLRSNLLQINSVNPQFYGLGTDLKLRVVDPKAQADIAALGITVPSWFTPLWNPSGDPSGADQLGQLLRPFPQYANIDSATLENAGQSTYNALLVKAERRFRNGLNLLASYTFSKTLTNADSSLPVFSGFNSNVFGAQNAFNLKAEKAVSYQDVPHTFVLSYLYELPAGPGKKFFSHGVASKVLGGWQIGAVHRYQSGAPVHLQAFAKNPPFSNGSFRFSVRPGVPLLSPNAGSFNPFGSNSGCTEQPDGTFTSNSGNNFFNCAALLDPNADSLVAAQGYTFGNLPPFFSGLRSPHYFSEDFSIIKRTLVTEGQFITFKIDLPNAFNRHNFGAIDGDPGSGSFGVPGGGGHAVVQGARQIQLTLRYEF